MIEIAQTAERGLLDMVFCADTHSAFTAHEQGLHRLHYVAWIEPFTMLAALASHTKNIGLVCTASTSFEQPYTVARKFASLDLVSGGRSGWNMVTSGNATEALNFGNEPHKPKDERYRRGKEFVEVVQALWDSWDDDAFFRDKEECLFFDPQKMHTLNHHGEHFDVRGPLNVPRSPQGQPVLVQAGASDDGRELAAQTAEVVFTAHPSIEPAKAFYADLKGRMARYGRNPDHLKIMPGLSITVGRTQDEALEKLAKLDELLHPDVGVSLLSTRMGHDLTGFPIDGPLPRAAAEQGDRQPLRRRHQDGAQQEHDHPRALPVVRAPARPCRLRRYAGRGRRPDGAVVQGRRLRRLQLPGAGVPDRAQRLRRHGRAGAAAPRALSHRL